MVKRVTGCDEATARLELRYAVTGKRPNPPIATTKPFGAPYNSYAPEATNASQSACEPFGSCFKTPLQPPHNALAFGTLPGDEPCTERRNYFLDVHLQNVSERTIEGTDKANQRSPTIVKSRLNRVLNDLYPSSPVQVSTSMMDTQNVVAEQSMSNTIRVNTKPDHGMNHSRFQNTVQTFYNTVPSQDRYHASTPPPLKKWEYQRGIPPSREENMLRKWVRKAYDTARAHVLLSHQGFGDRRTDSEIVAATDKLFTKWHVEEVERRELVDMKRSVAAAFPDLARLTHKEGQRNQAQRMEPGSVKSLRNELKDAMIPSTGSAMMRNMCRYITEWNNEQRPGRNTGAQHDTIKNLKGSKEGQTWVHQQCATATHTTGTEAIIQPLTDTGKRMGRDEDRENPAAVGTGALPEQPRAKRIKKEEPKEWYGSGTGDRTGDHTRRSYV